MNMSEILTVAIVYLPLVIFCSGYLFIAGISLFYGRKCGSKPVAIGEPYLPSISVVVPTYNEEEIIASRLDSLFKTTYPKDKMEVVIVDSSTDRTPIIIDEYSKRYPIIKLIHDNERKGLATALNQAFEACKGEIVVKMDSDLTLADNSLTEIISNFADPTIGAVTGKVNVANQKASTEVRYRGLHETIQKAETYLDSIYMAHTFSAYRRHLMKSYKTHEYGDETIQTIHIRKQGYKVIYDPAVNFFEDYPDDNKELLRQKIRRSEGLIRIILENVDLMFNRRYGKFGLYVYPSNFFMFIVSPILLLITLATAIVDLAFFSLAAYFDILILALLGLTILGRKRPVFSSIWTFIELQFAQLRALINVTMLRKRDYKWTKIAREPSQVLKDAT